MKAWHVTDRKGYTDYSVIVFAETRGKAISEALGTDEFPKSDWEFTELIARRRPALDSSYRGFSEMDWYHDGDRLALVRFGGYRCDDDWFDPDECKKCAGKDYCGKYEEYLEEEKDNEEED